MGKHRSRRRPARDRTPKKPTEHPRFQRASAPQGRRVPSSGGLPAQTVPQTSATPPTLDLMAWQTLLGLLRGLRSEAERRDARQTITEPAPEASTEPPPEPPGVTGPAL